MIRRLVSLLVLSTVLAAFVAGPASAIELWDPHLRGINIGLAAGALPPPDLYFINNAYWANFKGFDNSGNSTNVKLDAFVDVPILLWTPGVKLLGADYGVAIAQPFDYTNLTVPGPDAYGNRIGDSHWGTYNTIIVPAILSWKLPYNFYIAPSFSIYLPTASSSPPPPRGRIRAESGNGYWTFEPGLGISWLYEGWNLSADIRCDFNTENNDTDYWSAPLLSVDYTATKTIGKWTFGAGAYQQNQLAQDDLHGRKVSGSAVTNFGMGPVVGYNFGPVIVQATYQWNIYTRNDVGGDWFNVRFIIPISLGKK